MAILKDSTHSSAAKIGALALASFGALAGFSRFINNESGDQDPNIRFAAAKDDFNSMSLFDRITPISFSAEDSGVVDINPEKQYFIELAPGSFIKLYSSLLKEPKKNWYAWQSWSSNEKIIFEIPENNLRRYELKLESFEICNLDSGSKFDGSYLMLIDRENDREVVSAVLLPVEHANSLPGIKLSDLILLKSPDNTFHKVTSINSSCSHDTHKVPDHLRYIYNKIHPIREIE